MSLYTETGAINVVSNDTTKGRYSPTGALRINLVSGTAYTGLYAADGALNVVDVSGISANTYGGLYHPCGAIRARTALNTFTGLYAPDGSYYFNGLFSPLNLFAQGEQGVWYDPSDMTTLFQDAAGTIPVTAVEQPVGLMLDKSKGGIGPEIVSNGTFTTNATGWSITLGTGTVTASSGVGVVTRSVGASSYISATTAIPTVVGMSYIASGTLVSASANSVIGKSDSNTTINSNRVNIYGGPTGTTTPGSGTIVFTATATTTYIHLFIVDTGTGTVTASFDNISVRELPGNHASQSTSASRPVLSARVNLLTRTEEFDNAAWTKAAVTVTANTTTAPDGTTTADLLAEDTGNTSHQIFPTVSMTSGVTYVGIFHLKKGSGATAPNWVRLAFRTGAMTTAPWANFNLNTGAVGNTSGAGITASITSLSDGWYRCSVTAKADATSANGGAYVQFTNNSDTTASTVLNTYTGATTSNIYIWGADLRVTNAGANLPAYQRVGAATYGVTNPSVVIGNPDYDTNGFPMYLKFDGTDDGMATGTINPGAVDKAQVFAGVRKLSDAAAFPVIAELGDRPRQGSFTLGGTATAGSATYHSASQGTITAVPVTPTVYAAPITNVLAALNDISGDLATLRVNGTQAAQSTDNQGTGNFLSYPLYIGSRAGTSLRFNGQLYSLIARFSATNLPDATIAQTETWVNGKTGAY